MLVKVCGLKNPHNIKALEKESMDFRGFIFHEKSPRNIIQNNEIKSLIRNQRGGKVGVFVNESFAYIVKIATEYKLDYVQLHGDETPELVQGLIPYFKVIKAFSVDENFDFTKCDSFTDVDLFLFDTKGKNAGGNGVKFDWRLLDKYNGNIPFLLSGGIGLKDLFALKKIKHPSFIGIDVNSGFEIEPGIKNTKEIKILMNKVKTNFQAGIVDGYYGEFGGAFIPELLHGPVSELKEAFEKIKNDADFEAEFRALLKDYVGRPTPLYLAKRLSKKYGANIYLKREDLNHTGAHKINNTIGQVLLAKRMGKTRIIAETGAGQHGVATATVCALMGLECIVYMGEVDMERQKPNVNRMRMLGAEIIPATSGSKTLKDATNEAIRGWINHPTSFYLIGSVVGPAPYPQMVAEFQSVISEEIKKQLLEKTGKTDPDMVIACVGGGSNAAGAFYHYIESEAVDLIAVEAAGLGIHSGKSAATSFLGTAGIIHGSKTLMMQDSQGQIIEPHSISAGLDYPGIGPLHAHLITSKRAKAIAVTDMEALKAGLNLTRTEGIIPALESAHAFAALEKLEVKGKTIVINLSGRGDKDLATYLKEDNLI